MPKIHGGPSAKTEDVNYMGDTLYLASTITSSPANKNCSPDVRHPKYNVHRKTKSFQDLFL